MTAKEKIQRAVDSLETLYAVIIAFALTRAIETVLFDPSGEIDFARLSEHWPGLVAFVATIVPFYHGMHRHLSRTYIEETASEHTEGFLLLDFFVFFIESTILLVFASSLDKSIAAFYPLLALLVVDAAWAMVAHGIHYSEWKNSPWKWTAINVVTALLILLIIFSTLFTSDVQKLYALAMLAVIRTSLDYIFCWSFYFPSEKAVL